MAVYVVVAKDGMPVSRSAGADSGLGATPNTRTFSASSLHGVADIFGHLTMTFPGFQDSSALPGSSGVTYALPAAGPWGRLLPPPTPVARPGEGALHGRANVGSSLTVVLIDRRHGADFTPYQPSALNVLPTVYDSKPELSFSCQDAVNANSATGGYCQCQICRRWPHFSVMTGNNEIWTPPRVAHGGGFSTRRGHHFDYRMRTHLFKLRRPLREHGDHAVCVLRGRSTTLSE